MFFHELITLNYHKGEMEIMKKQLVMIFVVVFALFACPAGTMADSGGRIIYVFCTATGDNTGASWGNAFTTLQAALDVAQPGDEIWVAEGIYNPTSEYGPGIGERGKHFEMKNGVGIYGGFAGTESTRSGRDWTAHPATLSGDIGVVGDAGDNCYHVFYHPDGLALNQTAVLDGFSVTGGNANSGLHYYDYYGSGGGMYNINNSPTLTNVTFSGNSASGGGGICNYNSSPALTNVIFSGNRAGDGGGMLNYKSSPALNNVTFSENSAWSKGGGVTNSESSPTLTNVTFSKNLSSYEGGGMYNDKSSPTLASVTFSGNSGSGYGGCDGGGMYNYCSNPTLTNVSFSNNSSNRGGGMENWYSSPTLTNVTFSGNSVKYYGGGMYNYSSSPVLTNCILWGNSGAQIAAYEESSSIPTVTYSDIQGGFPGNGNIDADPLFEGPDNLRLQFGSPCINMGSNDAATVTTDLDGNPRIVGVNVDMGAYEFQGPFPASAPTWPSGSGLTAGNVTETGLTLTWTAATDDVGVTSYRIYKSGNILDTVDLDNVNGTPAPYSVTGLTAGTQYTFKVEAGDAEGNWSTTGSSVTVTTRSSPPTWPSGSSLTAGNVTDTGALTLTWTAATDDVGVTGYRIYEDGRLLDTVDGTTRYYNVTGFASGDIIKYWQFTFKVEAGDAEGAWSTTGPSVTVTNPMYDIPSGGGGGAESFPLPSATPSYFEQY